MKKLFLILFITTISILANIGNIMVVKGQADVKRSAKMVTAKNGMELLIGDEIITKTQSRVQVMLKDETIITIGPKSSFGFNDFIFDGTKNSKVSLKSNRGFFRSVTGKIAKMAPERFKVKTVSATIGIRGTDFSGEIIGDIELIKCYKGSISIDFKGISRDIDAGNMIELADTGVKIRKNISPMHKPKKPFKNAKDKGTNPPKPLYNNNIPFPPPNIMINEGILDIIQDNHYIEDKAKAIIDKIPETEPIVEDIKVIEPIETTETIETTKPIDENYQY